MAKAENRQKELLKTLARHKFTGTQYRIMLILMSDKPYTQSMLAEKLKINNAQNLTPAIRELKRLGFLEIDRVEGNNKFLKIGENWEILDERDVNQLTFL
ncbi:MAG: hypothetical protein K2K16_05055 [Ruminococcus sp.]|nr:hypothetical protein [Ruminococcus sp.]